MPIPVDQVNGIGPKTAEYLKERKITTAEALVESGLEVLVSAPGFNAARAQKVIDDAAKMIGTVTTPEAGPAQKPVKEKTKKSDKKKGKKGGKKDKKKDKKRKKKDKGKKGKKRKN